MTTMKEMCETIVESGILNDAQGGAPTAQQIYEYSPTGELFEIFGWYEVAKQVITERP